MRPYSRIDERGSGRDCVYVYVCARQWNMDLRGQCSFYLLDDPPRHLAASGDIFFITDCVEAEPLRCVLSPNRASRPSAQAARGEGHIHCAAHA